MRWSTILQYALFVAVVYAHPGEVHERLSEAEIAQRQTAAQKRHLQARSCASSIATYQASRKAKRTALRKRDSSPSSATLSADPPHYTNIQNYTCVTAPEVTEGPYYINNELIRQDLAEDQSGVKLVLDIGVVDTTTCEPLENVFVELWSANATGVYSSYSSARRGNGPGGPRPPPGGPRGPPRGTPPLTRNETFLRGGWHTDTNGIVELATLYPGFYTGRTAHIHTLVHANWSAADNGTLVSHAGSVIHVGQFFFGESWNDAIFAVQPYLHNPAQRTYNADDRILEQESADGNNALIDLELLGGSLSEGLLGYITMGVNSSASYGIQNDNYLNSSTKSTTSSSYLPSTLSIPLINILGYLSALALLLSALSRVNQAFSAYTHSNAEHPAKEADQVVGETQDKSALQEKAEKD